MPGEDIHGDFTSDVSGQLHFCPSNPCPICYPVYTYPPLQMVSKVPHRCPVCDGRGNVPAGFYGFGGMQQGLLSSTCPETCRACQGFGILWS